jgi:predicted CoA-binding protein
MRANPQKTPYTFARAYVHMGYAVLPLAPGEKRPHGGLVPNGLKEARPRGP